MDGIQNFKIVKSDQVLLVDCVEIVAIQHPKWELKARYYSKATPHSRIFLLPRSMDDESKIDFDCLMDSDMKCG